MDKAISDFFAMMRNFKIMGASIDMEDFGFRIIRHPQSSVYYELIFTMDTTEVSLGLCTYDCVLRLQIWSQWNEKTPREILKILQVLFEIDKETIEFLNHHPNCSLRFEGKYKGHLIKFGYYGDSISMAF